MSLGISPSSKETVENRLLPEQYLPKEIEPRWQAAWKQAGIFVANTKESGPHVRPKYYVLEMFPYPSGRLHMGHMRNYCLGDVLARAHRMAGYQVLYPLGWDAFGLPAENAALKAKVHPRVWTEKNIAAMKGPLLRMGLSYDESKEIMTCDPNYFVHEQRIFIEMVRRGLAYRKAAQVNFCPTCGTVLANEQVEDGLCWRCQSQVEQRDLEQWFIGITSYADQLLKDIQALEGKWPEKVLNMQKQWIGRTEGALVQFPLEYAIGNVTKIEVFTTRPDTLFGVSYLALAPEHPLAFALAKHSKEPENVVAFIGKMKAQDKIQRSAESAPKEGIFTGAYAIHPVTQEKVPIYLANFVLMDYGTGAVMSVPAHDQRDFDFAKQYQLPIKVVVRSQHEPTVASTSAATSTSAISESPSAVKSTASTKPASPLENTQTLKESRTLKETHPSDEAYTGPGWLINSGEFTGLSSEEAKAKIVDWLAHKGLGQAKVQFRLRDWLVSRQRYWGCPIPMVQCLNGGHGYQPVPESELPVQLPEDVDFTPGGPSPLARHPTWKHTTCPICEGPAVRETDTMDGFMESSWYFLRYPDPHNPSAIADEQALQFLPVDQYIGGAEHATKHLIYARFFTKMLSDFGHLPKDLREPFRSLLSQGMVLKDAYRCPEHDYLYPEQVTQDGHCTQCGKKAQHLRQMKMSKSFRNVVEPMPLIETYGADTARVFCLFAAPPDSVMEWSDASIEGSHRFLQRVYRLAQRISSLPKQTGSVPEERRDYEAEASKERAENKEGGPGGGTNRGGDANKERALRRKTHQTIRKVTHDVFERKQYNTAIASLMELTNTLSEHVNSSSYQTKALVEALESLILLLNPMAPHLCEEIGSALGHRELLALHPWPKHDDTLAKEEELTIVIQVNGKKRGEIAVAPETEEEQIRAQAFAVPNVAEHMAGKTLKKAVYVPGRLLNVVVA